MATATDDTPTTIPPSSSAAAASEEAPISPISHRTSFPHRTIAAAAVHPFIDTATPAINSDPVELDGTPTSPEARRDDDEEEDVEKRASGVFSPGEHDEVMEELSGLRGQGSREREQKRAALLSTRSKDPAVLVDIPQTPGAEELEIAGRAVHEGPVEDADKAES